MWHVCWRFFFFGFFFGGGGGLLPSQSWYCLDILDCRGNIFLMNAPTLRNPRIALLKCGVTYHICYSYTMGTRGISE